MSSRVRSELGTIGERVSGVAPGRSAHVEVRHEGQVHPGLLVSWQRAPQGWLAQVAWVEQGRLVVSLLPAQLVRPATVVAAPGPRDTPAAAGVPEHCGT